MDSTDPPTQEPATTDHAAPDHATTDHAAPDHATDRATDRRGGPGHNVVLAVVLAFPVVKVAWTVGGGDGAWDVLAALGPSGWPDILIGMIATNPWLAFVLAVTFSRMTFLGFAARGAIPHGRGRRTLLPAIAMSLISPLAFGLLTTVFFGVRWGVATAAVAWLLRQGVILEYRSGHRGHRGRSTRLTPRQHRLITFEQRAALVLTVVALPLVGMGVALDGQSWSTLQKCEVQVGAIEHGGDRLIELERMGNGLVGWDIDREQVVNAAGCSKQEGLYVREPWWRA